MTVPAPAHICTSDEMRFVDGAEPKNMGDLGGEVAGAVLTEFGVAGHHLLDLGPVSETLPKAFAQLGDLILALS